MQNQRRPNTNKIKYIWQNYAKIVAWLLDVVGEDDPRGFDPTPMFLFAHHYKLLHWEPVDIYKEYVMYQCAVYEKAAKTLEPKMLNTLSFGEIQQLFESGQLKDESNKTLVNV